MPPRKSDASKGISGDDGTPAKEREGTNIEDLGLPRTVVSRLAKGVLPANTQIQKDAVLAISKSATVFVSYLSANANDNALRSNKKTIMPKDVLEAISDLEFDDFKPRLEAELAKFNEIQLNKRNNARKKVADKAVTPGDWTATDANTNGTAASQDHGADSPRAAKKARRSSAAGVETNGMPADRPRADSGDETISEENGEEEVEDEIVSEEDVAEEDEEASAGEERGADDNLDTQDHPPPDDEALDNGEDSD